MKRILALTLTLVMVLSLTACGGGGSAASDASDSTAVATIVTRGGETVQKTREELSEEYESNSVSYDNKYEGASITFVGVVESVSEYYEPVMSNDIQKITFADGFVLKILSGSHNDIVNNVSKGDRLEVQSELHGADYFTVSLNNLHGSGNNMRDESVLKIVK